jgi:hypothetical protein
MSKRGYTNGSRNSSACTALRVADDAAKSTRWACEPDARSCRAQRSGSEIDGPIPISAALVGADSTVSSRATLRPASTDADSIGPACESEGSNNHRRSRPESDSGCGLDPAPGIACELVELASEGAMGCGVPTQSATRKIGASAICSGRPPSDLESRAHHQVRRRRWKDRSPRRYGRPQRQYGRRSGRAFRRAVLDTASQAAMGRSALLQHRADQDCGGRSPG